MKLFLWHDSNILHGSNRLLSPWWDNVGELFLSRADGWCCAGSVIQWFGPVVKMSDIKQHAVVNWCCLFFSPVSQTDSVTTAELHNCNQEGQWLTSNCEECWGNVHPLVVGGITVVPPRVLYTRHGDQQLSFQHLDVTMDTRQVLRTSHCHWSKQLIQLHT